MSELKVQMAVCKCGKPIKIAATSTSFDRATTREFAKLMEDGYTIKSGTIEEARASKLCFDKCK